MMAQMIPEDATMNVLETSLDGTDLQPMRLTHPNLTQLMLELWTRLMHTELMVKKPEMTETQMMEMAEVQPSKSKTDTLEMTIFWRQASVCHFEEMEFMTMLKKSEMTTTWQIMMVDQLNAQLKKDGDDSVDHRLHLISELRDQWLQ